MKTQKTIILLKVLFIFIILICLMQFIFAAIPSINVRIETNLFALRIPVDAADTSIFEALRWYIFVCAVPLYALILFAIAKVITLFRPLASGKTPFTDKSAAAIRHIGYACWIYAAVSTLVEYVGAQKLLQSVSDVSVKWSAQLNFPVAGVIVGLIMVSLADVFAQGLALKQDNDSII